ncbi:concanavalin A-like lectin/glucanase [Clavulina sp. PMI_390]|nr:concanavalin A-like lectin/glucanase [Clavulina sp. PMI_390]
MLAQILASSLLALSAVVNALEVTPENVHTVIDSSVQIRTHSIFAPYVDQDLQNRWFSFGADAYVNTNKHIRLTQDRPSETGWLWSRLPLTTANFQIDVEFKISGASSHLAGDGMAVWLTSRRAQSGPVFGFEDNFEGVGIFIDTFPNSHHTYAFPRISAMVGDGQTHYDVGNDGDKTITAACSANVRGLEIPTKMRITYLKGKWLDVKLQYKAYDEWTPCFTLDNPRLPPSPFLGFSALTGEVSEAHDIISVATNSILINTDLAGMSSSSSWSGKAPASKGGFFSSLFSLLLRLVFLAAIVAVGVVGWRAYGARLAAPYTKKYSTWDSKRF